MPHPVTRRRRQGPLLLTAAALLAVLTTACAAEAGSADALFDAPIPRTIPVSSPAFGDTIPAAYGCGSGDGVSPPLRWSGVPEGTVELAIVVDDPDATRTYVHWILFGLDPGLEELSAGTLPPEAKQASNSAHFAGYQPPCPPGTARHTYRFAVYALRENLDLPNGVGAGEALDAIRKTATASGVLLAAYQRGA